MRSIPLPYNEEAQKWRNTWGVSRPDHPGNHAAVALEALVDPDARGDPESPLRWTLKSTRDLADELTAQGHQAGSRTVAQLLEDELGFSLQSNRKTVEGKQHPDRDAQFHYINEQVRRFARRHEPVVSVDSKKKELVGNYKNEGGTWRPEKNPEKVKGHDFIDKELGKTIPYGIFDMSRNRGWVSVGIDHDTAAFAVASLRSWWSNEGRVAGRGLPSPLPSNRT